MKEIKPICYKCLMYEKLDALKMMAIGSMKDIKKDKCFICNRATKIGYEIIKR